MDAFSCNVNKKKNKITKEKIYCTSTLKPKFNFVAVMGDSDRLKTTNIGHQKSLKYAQNGALSVFFRNLISWWKLLNLRNLRYILCRFYCFSG